MISGKRSEEVVFLEEGHVPDHAVSQRGRFPARTPVGAVSHGVT